MKISIEKKQNIYIRDFKGTSIRYGRFRCIGIVKICIAYTYGVVFNKIYIRHFTFTDKDKDIISSVTNACLPLRAEKDMSAKRMSKTE